jgi:hypothetical protein
MGNTVQALTEVKPIEHPIKVGLLANHTFKAWNNRTPEQNDHSIGFIDLNMKIFEAAAEVAC